MSGPKTLIAQTSDEQLLDFYNNSVSLTELYQKIGYTGVKGISSRQKQELNQRLAPYNLSVQQFKEKNGINIAKPKPQKFCLNCGKPVNNKYCSPQCRKAIRDAEIITKWKATGDTSCAPGTNIRNAIREYIYQKQNYQCAICGMQNIWNGQKINFVLDHIDGNAANGYEENLRLICPNCNSQLPTFKSRNKHSARAYRRT